MVCVQYSVHVTTFCVYGFKCVCVCVCVCAHAGVCVRVCVCARAFSENGMSMCVEYVVCCQYSVHVTTFCVYGFVCVCCVYVYLCVHA